MIDFPRILLSGLAPALWIAAAGAQSQEYLPPPTGPYQSSVVINTMERNSNREAQVYRFPPADLALPDRDFYPPPADFNLPQSPGAIAGNGPGKLSSPADAPVDFTREMPPAATANNPWGAAVQPVTPRPADPAVWGTAPYGYSAYPYGYYNGYMANPYPSPWAVNPAPAYPGR